MLLLNVCFGINDLDILVTNTFIQPTNLSTASQNSNILILSLTDVLPVLDLNNLKHPVLVLSNKLLVRSKHSQLTLVSLDNLKKIPLRRSLDAGDILERLFLWKMIERILRLI